MRYFENYSLFESRQPISEGKAKRLGTYSVEVTDQEPRHVRDFLNHELERVIYPESSPSPELVTWHRESYPGVRFWVVSPITYVENEPSYTIWYYAGDGTLEKRVEYENRPLVGISRWFHPDGRLGGSMERRFHEWGEHIETITRDETGRIVSIDD